MKRVNQTLERLKKIFEDLAILRYIKHKKKYMHSITFEFPESAFSSFKKTPVELADKLKKRRW
jgi:hypothetical protein